MPVTGFGLAQCDGLAARVLEYCKRHGVKIAAAESLTGGLLADAFVRIPGASEVFLGSAVTYDIRAKAKILGVDASLLAREGAYAQLRLRSGEIRKVRETCSATVGQLANADWMNVRIGTAGRKRHMGWRPSVRGKVMNPVDHPHGGGEGSNPIGMKYPKTPWGRHALGVKTRDAKKYSNKAIIRRRIKK